MALVDLAPGLRAIPAARRAVIAFTVDDDAKEVLIHCITCSGADWVRWPRKNRLVTCPIELVHR